MTKRAKCKNQNVKNFTIEAKNLHYRALNEKIHQAIEKGYRKITLNNICGQRYVGTGLKEKDIHISINGTPGNDLAAFMEGPHITVEGNTQDAVGNTMNAGEVIIKGDAGDIIGYSMRGGRIFVKGDAGYRVGIHMKAYKDLYPVIIVGGTARDFLGEYMAGGLLVVLGLNSHPKSYNSQFTIHSKGIVGDFVGTGMHGGSIFIRGEVDERSLGREVKISRPTKGDMIMLKTHLTDYCRYFDLKLETILKKPFLKLYPHSHRPYGRLYAY
ncbi:MAG TPA: hypothetical protein EYP78_06895 [Candidatus Omnitrophica bacterium]|nr:hypothetical protein [Candidatus Omnitrophota bacterium]